MSIDMIAASFRPETAHSSYGLSRQPDRCLRVAAQQVLQSSGYAALRKLRCEVRGAVAVVHGVLPSYYLKQVTQSVLQRLDGIRSVRNLVEVQETVLNEPVDDDLQGERTVLQHQLDKPQGLSC
jgi:hypothetical protein